MGAVDKRLMLEQLMNDYGDQLTRLAYSYVKDTEIAKDLVQNTFVKCFLNIDTFKHNSTIKTWLYRITINECKDYIKSWDYKKVKVLDIFQSHTKKSQSAEEIVMDKTERKEIQNSIFRLPMKYREIIFLYYFEEMTMEEISSLTELSINTIKTRLRRGKMLLKQKLERRGIYEQ
ncbi:MULTISPECIES: sigma-70 family RNA polymerase sigma factor [Bacillus]|uniref:sigma-70 family RNA polymerase sigma factor n=1 Tax=Bacillus TaxID=1386 RepID=UPI000BB781A2|nr:MULTISPECIES: sigma-70 family RNA polymerase sigma factor [Bacillus]